MGEVIDANRVVTQDSNMENDKLNKGIGESVYECVKMLANKSKVSTYFYFAIA